MIEDRRNIRGDEVRVLADANCDAAGVADAHDDQSIRQRPAHHDDSMRTAQPPHRLAGCLDQVTARIIFCILLDQLHDDLGIGLGAKLDAFCQQFGAQFQIIFHDAVVDEDEIAVHTEVWVGIALRWDAVRRPAGMADADVTAERLLRHTAAEIR